MASDKTFLNFVLGQLAQIENINAKSMFGEYVVYADSKLFGSVCDNKLYIKPTEAGRAFIQDVVEASPYPGAKPNFLIEDKIEDPEWLTQLVNITVEALPAPKKKKKKNQ